MVFSIKIFLSPLLYIYTQTVYTSTVYCIEDATTHDKRMLWFVRCLHGNISSSFLGRPNIYKGMAKGKTRLKWLLYQLQQRCLSNHDHHQFNVIYLFIFASIQKNSCLAGRIEMLKSIWFSTEISLIFF